MSKNNRDALNSICKYNTFHGKSENTPEPYLSFAFFAFAKFSATCLVEG